MSKIRSNKLLLILRHGSIWTAIGVSVIVLISALIEILLVYSVSLFFATDKICLNIINICLSKIQFIYIFSLILILRTVFTLLMNYVLFRFSLQYIHLLALEGVKSLSTHMFYNLEENEKLHILYNEVNQVVNNLVHPLLMLLRDIVTVGGALIYVAFQFPSDTTYFGMCFIIVTTTYTIVLNGILKKWGPTRQLLDRNRLQVLKSVARMHKFFVYTTRDENTLVTQMNSAGKAYFDLVSKYMFLRSTNRYVLELTLFALVGLGFIVGTEKYLLFLSSMAIVGLRAMPALTNLISFINTYNFHLPALEQVYSIIEPRSRQLLSHKELNLSNALQKTGSKLRFEVPKNSMFETVDVEIEGPGLVAISGPSGCGKSTLLECLVRHSNKFNTAVEFFSPSEYTQEYLSLFGYCEQQPNIIDASLLENLKLFSNSVNISDRKIIEIAEKLSLEKALFNRPKISNDTLSGGQKKKIGILRLIISDKPIWLIDEPTSELDENSGELVREIIEDYSLTKYIIIATHDQKLIDKSKTNICLN